MTDTHTSAPVDEQWWRQAVVYQIYPRSFQDSDSDGLGDLAGITQRIPYLASLGIDAVWLSPFYPSPLADGGYDVADYRNVDPRLGTLDDFDELVEALHTAGLRIFVDVVPNHSSDQHPWFTEAVAAGPGSPERDRYVFRDGRGPDGSQPPNDWPSHFGPTAWTRVIEADRTPGQWYLHLFAPEQPDFNWDNPDVNDDFVETLTFWSDRGVDGFRIDVAHALKKDLSTPYAEMSVIPQGDDLPLTGDHPLFDRNEVHEVYRRWRTVFDAYAPPRVAVAEVNVRAERRTLYAQSEELGQAFNFDLLNADWDAQAFRTIIARNVELAAQAGSSSTWTLSNHDVVRHATRYGLPAGTDLNAWLLSGGQVPTLDRPLGVRRARAATLLLFALPGSVYLYQGEELGLHEVAELEPGDLQDPIWLRDGGTRKGRDGCRVPLPWTAEAPAFGFTRSTPHLPMPSWMGEVAVATQESEQDATVQVYRDALRVRRNLLADESLEWHEAPEGALWFSRPGGWHCLTNFDAPAFLLPEGAVVMSSADLASGLVEPATTVWLQA